MIEMVGYLISLFKKLFSFTVECHFGKCVLSVFIFDTESSNHQFNYL